MKGIKAWKSDIIVVSKASESFLWYVKTQAIFSLNYCKNTAYIPTPNLSFISHLGSGGVEDGGSASLTLPDFDIYLKAPLGFSEL